MKISRIQPLRSRRINPLQDAATVARTTYDMKEQLRIARNSGEPIILMALALNKSLHKDAVQELFNRDHKGVSKRLKGLGYKEDLF